jgi:hypothetical protein
MDFHTEISLLAFSGLMPIWITRFIFVFSGTGRMDNRGIDHRALRNQESLFFQVGINGL